MNKQPARSVARVDEDAQATGLPEVRHVIDLFTESNPRSVYSLVSEVAQMRIKDAMKESDLFRLDERDLKKRVSPTPTDNRIRLCFWNEFERAQARGIEKMQMDYVFVGACTKQYFYHHFLTDPKRVAWMLCPPSNYASGLEELLTATTDKMREIVDMPLVDPKTGKRDHALMALIHKIHVTAENRVKGGVLQRQRVEGEFRSMSLSANVDVKDPVSVDQATRDIRTAVENMGMEEIQKRKKHLEELKRAEARKHAAPVDAEDAEIVSE